MFRIRYFLSKKNIFTIRPIDTAIYMDAKQETL